MTFVKIKSPPVSRSFCEISARLKSSFDSNGSKRHSGLVFGAAVAEKGKECTEDADKTAIACKIRTTTDDLGQKDIIVNWVSFVLQKHRINYACFENESKL